jgi:hypothetical protein
MALEANIESKKYHELPAEKTRKNVDTPALA